jgi:S1-C subfamily serine protease
LQTQGRPQTDFHPYGQGHWPSAPSSEPSRRRKHWTTAAVLVSGIAGGLVGAAVVFGLLFAVPQLGFGTDPAPITIQTDGQASPISAVAQKVLPSVVNITTRQAFINTLTGEVTLRTIGTGSGVIYREDGYIVTNYHVIADADRIEVTVGVEDLEAEVVGTDPSSDLAVISVDRTGLPAAEFGDSTGLQVGQTVAAVGSPFGLDRSVTAGIVSALSRSSLTFDQSGVTAYTNLIQTDAAINPGNSGGALVDEEGRVIGINTLIESPSGSVGAPQSAGIGFAIPSDYVVEAAAQLIENGCVVHPYMGVSTATLDEATIRRFGLPVDGGALVQFVTPDSPADDAGMEAGDIIVRIGDHPIEGFGDVFTAIRAADVGQTVEVEVVRDGDRRVFEPTLIEDTACEAVR